VPVMDCVSVSSVSRGPVRYFGTQFGYLGTLTNLRGFGHISLERQDSYALTFGSHWVP
jgi:hypothetical protein